MMLALFSICYFKTYTYIDVSNSFVIFVHYIP